MDAAITFCGFALFFASLLLSGSATADRALNLAHYVAEHGAEPIRKLTPMRAFPFPR